MERLGVVHARVPMQNGKSLRVGVIISVTLVNRRTDRQFLTGCTISSSSMS